MYHISNITYLANYIAKAFLNFIFSNNKYLGIFTIIIIFLYFLLIYYIKYICIIKAIKT